MEPCWRHTRWSVHGGRGGGFYLSLSLGPPRASVPPIQQKYEADAVTGVGRVTRAGYRDCTVHNSLASLPAWFPLCRSRAPGTQESTSPRFREPFLARLPSSAPSAPQLWRKEGPRCARRCARPFSNLSRPASPGWGRVPEACPSVCPLRSSGGLLRTRGGGGGPRALPSPHFCVVNKNQIPEE